jgi:hypothetical protein
LACSTCTGLAGGLLPDRGDGVAAGQRALTTCRSAGFEPALRYISTDLGTYLRLLREG